MSRQLLAAALLAVMLPSAAQPAETTGSVWKSPTCGCCKVWVDYMQKKGYSLAVKDVPSSDLTRMKAARGINPPVASCHTAEIGGYVIEGHVPAEDVTRLLAEKPDAIGLSVPRMPVGSPGMEMDGTVDPFEVLLIRKDGSSEVFSRYGKDAKF